MKMASKMIALLLALVLCMGMMPRAFAAQQDSYHDPSRLRAIRQWRM